MQQNFKITLEELIKKQTSTKEFTLLHTEHVKSLWLLHRLLWTNFLAKGLLTINRTTYTTFSSFKASLRRFSYTWLILRQSIELTGKKLTFLKTFMFLLKFWGGFTKCSEFAKSRAIRASVVYVPTWPSANVPKACQLFNLVCQRPKRWAIFLSIVQKNYIFLIYLIHLYLIYFMYFIFFKYITLYIYIYIYIFIHSVI